MPSSYLGLPLGDPQNSVTVWDGIEERFRKRLALWKRQYISKGGRITLIRSTLSSLPIYFMSLFRMPRRVRLRLEQIQRDFVWGGGNFEKKPHLVKWSTVCLDRKMGGLGIKSLAILNNALLCKWIWRFANERDSLWRNVILWKFGEERGGWCSAISRDAYGSGVWKEILLLLLSLWGMEGDFAFGRMLGVGKRPSPALTPPFLPWQLIKRSL